MSFYYNLDKLYSYPDWIIALIVGERGVGKTMASKLFVLNRFLKTGEQFVYLRRYKTELDLALTTFWDDVTSNGYFKDHDLRVEKGKLTKFICDGKVCGYAAPLSTSNILKSTAFPKVNTIIFDEAILDPMSGIYRYIKNEVQLLLEIYETIFRLRNNGRLLMLGNNVNFYGCPYVAYFNLELPYGSEFKLFKEGGIIVNYIKNEAYREAKKKSKFGKLIEGSAYGDYAISNKSLRENNNFIAKRPSKCRFFCILVINGENYGVWQGIDGYLYISDKYDPNSPFKFACTYDDHTEHTIFLNYRENYCLRYCIRAYKQGWLKFENIRIKSVTQGLFNKCLSI